MNTASLAIRETETWTPGSVVAGVILVLLVAAIVAVILRVTLRR